MAEVAAAAAALVALLPQIMDLGNRWYKAHRTWKQIPEQLERLRKQHDTYMTMINQFGLPDDHDLREMLENAKILVGKRQDIEDRRQISFLAGCCFKGNAYFFPHKLEEFLKDLEAYNNVFTDLQQNQRAREVIKKERFAKDYSFKISGGGVNAYVPLRIDQMILDALERKNGPSVVLLHGDPGTGKSILARYMVVHYREHIRRKETPFSLVVFLECGSGATVSSKQRELLTKLDPEDSPDISQDDAANSIIKIQHRIQCLLSVRNALVILDDVWESTFIEAFVGLVNGTSRSNVKLLVTSRKFTLWEDSVQVQTERIELKEAEKILACHAGLPGNDLPQDLKDVAQVLVDRADYNPLALAMAGKRINRKKKNDVAEWQRVANSYEQAMKEAFEGEGARVDLRSVLDSTYVKNIWETLFMTYRELKPDAKCLLILIANCEVKSIPDHVVYMLYTRLVYARGGGPGLFDDHKNTLMESGTMLQTNIQFLEYRDPNAEGYPLVKREYETLGLHDLQRNFIKHHRETRKDVEDVMTSLQLLSNKTVPNAGFDHEIICDDPHRDAVFALCALYLQETLAESAAKNLGISAIDYGHWKKLRGAMEHLPFLMQDRLSEYDEKLAHCVRQVYVKVVRNGEIEDNGLQSLLWSLHYGPPMISTLHHLWITGLGTAIHTPGTIKSLLESSLMSQHTEETSCSAYRKLHLHGLGCLAMFTANNKEITEFPGARHRLMGCLSLGQNSTLREIAAKALADIALHEHGRRRIGEVPGFIPKLLKLFLQRDGSVEFQKQVLITLGNLAIYDANAKQILGFAGALEALLDGLSGGSNSQLVRNVARTLASVAVHEDGQRRIGEVPGSIPKLLKLFLERDGNVEIQCLVLATLWILALNEANAKQILGFAGALDALLDGLSGGSNSNLMMNVAGTLGNVAKHEDGRRRIGEVPGSISKLLKLFLERHGSVEFQCLVLVPLCNLALYEANAKQILGFAGALEALLDALSGGGNSKLMTNVAGTLASVAQHVDGRKRIGEVLGSISKLLKLFLERDGNVEFQCEVVRTLRNLAIYEANAIQILRFSGGLEALLDCLSGGNNSQLMKFVAETLNNIAIHEDGQRRIGEVPGSISKLLKLFLERDGNVELHYEVIGTLWNLAIYEANAMQILGLAGALEALLDGLSDGSNSQLMTYVAGTLGSIAIHEDGRRRIGEVPGSISKLLKLFLERDGSVAFQCVVLRALCNLAIYEANAMQILGLAGALEALLDGLSDGSNSQLMTFVAGTLGSIAIHEDGRRRIGEVPGSISKLLKLFLERDGSVAFQCAVLRALCNLATYEANAMQILGLAGALEALLDGLSDGSNSQLMTYVAGTLGSIAIHEDGRRRIGGVPGSISKLLKLFLERDESVVFQCVVLRTLCNLATYEANAMQILGFAGAMEALLDGLSSGSNSQLMTNVAGTLCSIAIHKEGKRIIGEIPESIPIMLTRLFLAEGTVECLQEQLVETLGI